MNLPKEETPLTALSRVIPFLTSPDEQRDTALAAHRIVAARIESDIDRSFVTFCEVRGIDTTCEAAIDWRVAVRYLAQEVHRLACQIDIRKEYYTSPHRFEIALRTRDLAADIVTRREIMLDGVTLSTLDLTTSRNRPRPPASNSAQTGSAAEPCATRADIRILPVMRHPLVISHAACGGHAPPNTLAGIRKAIELGSDAIEIDVQASADGVPVLMHDLTVDRTTNGTGAVASLTLEELRALDAGGEPVPTLAEVLDLTRGRVLLVIEIKQLGIEERIVDVVRGANALGDVMAWSFFPEALWGMRRVEPRIPCALLVSPQSLPKWPEVRETALRLGLQGVSVFHARIDERTALDCQRCGLALFTWTPDENADIRRLLDIGVDGVCTNYPDRAVALLAGI